MNLTIITPCARPDNLKQVKKSINLNCKWIIVYDSELPKKQFKDKWIYEYNIKGGVSGNLQRNFALDKIVDKDTWIYFLDDDNLLHPYFKVITNNRFNKWKGFIFAQELPFNAKRYPVVDKIKVCHIDQAQYLLHISLIGEKRFVQQYEADGIFIEEIFKEHSDKIMVTNEVLCYYNKLRQ